MLDTIAPTLLGPDVIVDSYRIERVLGEGATATVYAAVHDVLGHRVAIKVLREKFARTWRTRARFAQEAMAVTSLVHPNLVDVSAFGNLPDGRPYIVMEHLMGVSLADHARGAPMSVAEVAPIAVAMCSALGAVHAHGVIHRDVKPTNIFVTTAGVVKLLDFGVAKLQDEALRSFSSTEVGVILGTPHYMSPEQARGETISPATDVYALGVVLYELLAGARPFDSRHLADLLLMHVEDAPPPLATTCEIPTGIARIVDAMLAKHPEDRPSLDEIAAAFAPRRCTARWLPRALALVFAALALHLVW